MTKKHHEDEGPIRLSKKQYEVELAHLQTEMVAMQEWIRATGQRLVVIMEGRDTAGKGGIIRRMTYLMNPRYAKVVALPAPTERQRTQWYFQRYVAELPAAGEIVIFDRSWYNRAGVERVMGFCTDEEYEYFMRVCPILERALVRDGITLVKRKFLGSNEKVRCSWGQVHVWSADGSFCIGAKDDKKVNAGISYIHGANTHVLEQAIRMGFKKPGMRRLSELLQ